MTSFEGVQSSAEKKKHLVWLKYTIWLHSKVSNRQQSRKNISWGGFSSIQHFSKGQKSSEEKKKHFLGRIFFNTTSFKGPKIIRREDKCYFRHIFAWKRDTSKANNNIRSFTIEMLQFPKTSSHWIVTLQKKKKMGIQVVEKKKDILNYHVKKKDSGRKSPKTKIATGQTRQGKNSFRKILMGIFNRI